MADRPSCKRCSQLIAGVIKVNSYRKKLGNQSLNIVDYYCEECFDLLGKERALNEHKRKEADDKGKGATRVRR